jgi:hypothetical protein
MGWAEHRIAEYQRGQPASWLERRMLEHANPVHFALALAASVGFVYGLWAHAWPWVIGAAALALLGHAYCWTRPKKSVDEGPGLAESAGSVWKAG